VELQLSEERMKKSVLEKENDSLKTALSELREKYESSLQQNHEEIEELKKQLSTAHQREIRLKETSQEAQRLLSLYGLEILNNG
jgi:ElaB/YqjD/DUF883 family membrane-anchored ribosome-binding protein